MPIPLDGLSLTIERLLRLHKLKAEADQVFATYSPAPSD